jgi:xylose isomerase
MLARAATVRGLTDVDLNYPDHFAGTTPAAMAAAVRDLGLAVNGLAMRYYGDPALALGAFTNPDPAVRQAAIDLTRRGIDAAAEMGAPLMTLWLGQDGWDTPFQVDYGRLWELEVAGLRAVAIHNPTVAVSVEYKPDEPRAFALLRDAATTLLAIREAGAPNLGVTLDFAHALYAGEQPAAAAALIGRHSRLLGVHLNDGYGRRDDGLMVGAVHTLQTVELLAELRRQGYAGALYFDTFPDATGLDPVRECETNIATVRAMLDVVDRLAASNALTHATAAQDAPAAMALVQTALAGGS